MSATELAEHGVGGLPAIAGGIAIRSPERRLIFGAPVIGEAEVQAVAECLRSHWIGLGGRVEDFEREFCRYKGAPYAVAVSSGTAALHLSLVGLRIGPGDEVLAPTMTFCATVNSILLAGATPVLVDCDRASFNIDPAALEPRVTPRTKAILVVHMCGRCCDMDPILEVSRKHRLRVIEDCAHAIESTYDGRPTGLLGDVGCFSFYPTKSITTGDGGMVITNDKRLHRRIKTLSLHGMTSDAWTRNVTGGIGYKVVAAGFKYNMTDVAAAMGIVQLGHVEAHWRRRQEIWHAYNDQLKGLPLVLPPPPRAGDRHAYHLYTPLLLLEQVGVSRDYVIAALHAENIGAGVHYEPVHMQPFYRRKFRYRALDFPNAAFVGESTLSLPLSADLSAQDVSDVCSALRRILHYFSAAAEGRSRKTPLLTRTDALSGV